MLLAAIIYLNHKTFRKKNPFTCGQQAKNKTTDQYALGLEVKLNPAAIAAAAVAAA